MNSEEIIRLPPEELRAALKEAWERIHVLEREAKQLVLDVQTEQHLTQMERIQRVAAQRGLVPYVRGLEAFSRWLQARPEIARQVEAEMRANGLWDIKLGYDPDKDITLSVISLERT